LVATNAAVTTKAKSATDVIAGPSRWTFIGISSSGSPTNLAPQPHCSALRATLPPQQGQSISWALFGFS
jgi:hypothetical protein